MALSEKVLTPIRTTDMPCRQTYFKQQKAMHFNFSNRQISLNLIKAYPDDEANRRMAASS